MTPTAASDAETAQPVIALIAGEDSGDVLGAALAVALRRRYPNARFVGIAGPRMRAVGVEAWQHIDELSVMGLAEVLRHLPRLLRLRRRLGNRLLQLRPDIVIGIDAPDFNLGLERRLKRAGLRAVHYVSPSIWAWREKRAASMAACADLVLCLLPMEPAIYARHGTCAKFVGHPLADQFGEESDRGAARRALALPVDAQVLAVLPGSRQSEIKRLGEVFLQAAEQVATGVAGLRVVIPAANEACHAALTDLLRHRNLPVDLLVGQAQDALRAADVVLVASGTAALEAMLAHRAMVVGYRISALTYRVIRSLHLMKTTLYSLPNVLAGRRLVPELMQDDCQPQALADAVLTLFRDDALRARTEATCAQLHAALKAGLDGSAADHAAAAIAELLETRHALR